MNLKEKTINGLQTAVRVEDAINKKAGEAFREARKIEKVTSGGVSFPMLGAIGMIFAYVYESSLIDRGLTFSGVALVIGAVSMVGYVYNVFKENKEVQDGNI